MGAEVTGTADVRLFGTRSRPLRGLQYKYQSTVSSTVPLQSVENSGGGKIIRGIAVVVQYGNNREWYNTGDVR